MKLDIIRTITDLEPHCAELSALQRQVSGSFFIGPAWIYAFHRVLAKDSVVHYVIGRKDDGHIAGYLPVWITNTRFLKVFHPRILALAGTCSTVSPEHLDALCLPDFKEGWLLACAETLAAKKSEYDFVIFESVAERAPLIHDLIGHLGSHGFRAVSRLQDTCLYLPLPDRFDKLLESYSANMRKIVRRTIRRTETKFRLVDFSEIGPFEKAFEEARRLHVLSRGQKGEQGSFDRPGYIEFHRELARQLAAHGGLYFVFLMDGDRPVSFRYGFIGGSVYYDYQTGYDPVYADDRPGFLILARVIQEMIDRGVKEVDFLRGDEPYKRHWTDMERKTYRHYLFPPGAKPELYYRLLKIYGSMK